MEREVQNLIKENNELLATKNALNIVKNDLITKVDELQNHLTMRDNDVQQLTAVKDKLKSRINDLDEELKKCKEKLSETCDKLARREEEDDENIPMMHRKRFTRVEMARVLMERNQLRDKNAELIESMKWSQLIQANRADVERKSFWKFFSNLLRPSGTASRTQNLGPIEQGIPAIRYHASSLQAQVSPILNSTQASNNRRHSSLKTQREIKSSFSSSASTATLSSTGSSSPSPSTSSISQTVVNSAQTDFEDFIFYMDSDINSERSRSRRRKTQPSPVLDYNGRLQLSGWSVANVLITGPSAMSSQMVRRSIASAVQNTPIPVPSFCRQLASKNSGLKIWCATAADLTGNDTGIACSSNSAAHSSNGRRFSDVSAVSSRLRSSTEASRSAHSERDGSDSIIELENELNLVIGDCTEFPRTKHLSPFTWVCGVSRSRSEVTVINVRENTADILDTFTFKAHLTAIESIPGVDTKDLPPLCSLSEIVKKQLISVERDSLTVKTTSISGYRENNLNEMDETSVILAQEDADNVDDEKLERLEQFAAYVEPPSSPEGCSYEQKSTVYQAMSTRLSTMWIGGQNGTIYVHSSIAQWSHCIGRVSLGGSIVGIKHFRGRVFVACDDGKCCVFGRDETGEWDLSIHVVIDIGEYEKRDNEIYNIRCIEPTKNGYIWLAACNSVYIVDPVNVRIVHTFKVHPLPDSQVRQLAAMGDGVWCCLRMNPIVRLFSARKPYQHMQDIDIEPLISMVLVPKPFNFVHITAMRVCDKRLWIGTSNGIVINLPCELSSSTVANRSRALTESDTGCLTLSESMPKCDVKKAQVSYHGHSDGVKFFICSKSFVASGGDGYVDFRLGATNNESNVGGIGSHKPYLILWKLP